MAAASKPTRYLFDRDFAGRSRAEEMFTQAQHRLAIAEAEERAFAAGAAAGREAERETAAGRLAATIDRLGDQVARELARSAERGHEQEAAAIELALELAKKLAGGAIARFPAAAIEAAASECFGEARGAPHIAVRVGDALVEEVRERLAALAADRGFSGKLIVLGDPDIAPGDARLEWADGGVVRERAKIEDAIGRVIEKHITSVEMHGRQGADRS